MSLGGDVVGVGGIAAGLDGDVYVSVSTGQGEGVERITPSGQVTDLQPSEGLTGITAVSITAGPDGNIWLTEDGKIGQVVIAKPAAASTPVSASSSKTASQLVSKTPTNGITTDAAIAALFAGTESGSTTAPTGQLTVIDPGTPTSRHKKS